MKSGANRLGHLAYRFQARARHRATRIFIDAFGQSWSTQQIEGVVKSGSFRILSLTFSNAFDLTRWMIGNLRVNRGARLGAHGGGPEGGPRRDLVDRPHRELGNLPQPTRAKRGYAVNVVAKRIYLGDLNQKLVEMREKMGG